MFCFAAVSGTAQQASNVADVTAQEKAQGEAVRQLDVATLQQRAQAGDAESQAELGDRYLKGGALWDPAQGLSWETKSAEQGNVRGEYLLGMTYGNRKIGAVSPDQGLSIAWLRRAANQRYAPAAVALGYTFANGINQCQDLVQSALWFRQAAEAGDAQAQSALGDAYEFGKGVPRDLAQARKWYAESADQNYDFAKSQLRLLQAASHAVPAAAPILEKSADGCVRGVQAQRVLAELGDPRAEENVGASLEESGDYAQALTWYLRASDYWGTGNGNADYSLVRIAVRLYSPGAQETADQLASRLGAAAQKNSSAGSDFRTMTAAQVLKLLLNADEVKAEIKGTSFPPHDKQDPEWAKSCNGMKTRNDVARAYAGENACFQVFTHYAHDAFSDISNTANLNFVMDALIRGCGLYASSQDKAFRGRTCGVLGRTLYGIGNAEAAKAVWELAPGCYSHDERTGSPLNGCVRGLTGGDGNFFRDTTLKSYGSPIEVFRGEPQRLVRLMFQSCNTVHDRDSCEFLQQNGANVNMAAVEQAENERHEALEEFRAERKAEAEQEEAAAEARRNAIFGALASMGGSNSTAVLDAGNRQAVALRAIGDANSARQPSSTAFAGSTQTPALRNVATSNSGMSTAVGVSNTATGAPETSSTTAPDTTTQAENTPVVAHYVDGLPANCIGQFWDPKYYNWLSFQNNCGQAIHLEWIAASPNDTFGMSAADLAAGAAVNSGWNQAEVQRKDGFLFSVCPVGYLPVDNNGQGITRANQTFRCKQQ